MRVSTSTINNMATSSMGDIYKKYMDIMNKIAANKNFTSVSENVTDATKVLKLNDQLAQIEQYQSNIQAATNEMNLAYDTLGAINDEIGAIRNLVVSASNATTTHDAAKAYAAEIKEKVAVVMDKMNTKYLDSYIFSGSYIQERTYELDGDNVIYNGSSKEAGDRKLTISKDTTFTYNVTGEEIFKMTKDADGNEVVDFFNQMKELDELLNSQDLDLDKVREKLTVLDEAIDGVTQAQGDVSAKVAKLDSTKSINEDTMIKLTGDKVDLEEVDITKAATELSQAYTALQASYQIGTQIIGGVSLLDYI